MSQETIAILTGTVALAALILTTTAAGIRAEAQADRIAAQAAAEANRAAFEAVMRTMYERTDAERHRFEAEILGLTREQATRAAVIESRPTP